MKKIVKYKFGSKPTIPVKSGIKIRTIELNKELGSPKESYPEPIELLELDPKEPTQNQSSREETCEVDYDSSVNWTEPFKIEIEEIDKYKILALSAKEQKERELITNPITQKFKALLKQELDKALAGSPAFMKAREQKDQAIRDFLIRNYKDLPKNVLISRVFVEEGYAECVDNQEEADKVRKLIGA